jgi:hypothetical protein
VLRCGAELAAGEGDRKLVVGRQLVHHARDQVRRQVDEGERARGIG